MLIMRKYIPSALVLVAALLSACTLHHVSSSVIKPLDSPVERLVIVIQNDSFNGRGTAANLGNRNLQSLIPHLESRLPAMFMSKGIEARAVVSGRDADRAPVQVATHEATLMIFPVSAFYSTQSGQHLKLRAVLLETGSAQPVWNADINMSTPGFGKFDAELADKIAVDLLQKLRHDRMIKIGSEHNSG